MIKEYQAFFEVFKEGKELKNPAIWKNRQIAGNAVFGLLSAIVVICKSFGFDFHIDEATLMVAASGISAIVMVVNSVLTAITSSKVGIKSKEAK